MDPVDYANTSSTWGSTSSTTFNRISAATWTVGYYVTLAGGTDSVPTDGNIQTAYGLFANKETIDVALILTADASVSTQQYVIDNLATSRKDCVAFISPPSANVVNQAGSESTNINSWLTALSRSSSYVVADSGWKYQYDKYNNVYRYIPLNGDIAGLCVYTDSIKDPWFSPAGLNRGAIKNCIKLAWNPTKTYRDTLYAAGVNPVVTFPGQGTVLFGDKTLQSKPSAFDRINVRRLFITLEKSIAKAAQYSLFELNDEFTRAQFISLVTPFLRDIQGRRGITDFKVVCDGTNNTSNVIDSNQFVGDIYIKPARSINFIQLNFVAVGTGVDFNTIVGVA
jgi:phage tail sheath protein FI